MKRLVLVTCLFVTFSLSVKSELPTAQQIANKMTVGWNLGNTLEAIGSEETWGAGRTSQQLIDSVKASGFNTVRLPVSWFIHSDTVTSVIHKAWMERVKEVVDYCIKNDMYVILNMHWDKGWLENRVDKANQAIVNKRLKAYWTQIANYFNNYDEHLLFACANEPAVHNSVQMSVLLSYHQTFIDAVRATKGNNSFRTLIVQGPSTDIDETYKLMNVLPIDKLPNRMMVEVHFYIPYQFCLMEKDADWGKRWFYWGKGNHSKKDITRNATKDEEEGLEKKFESMKTKFVDKGIPVIIGEFGAFRKKLHAPSEQALHNASIDYFYRYTVRTALNKGMIPVCWDVPGLLYNRKTAEQVDRAVIDAIMQGKKEAVRYKY